MIKKASDRLAQFCYIVCNLRAVPLLLEKVPSVDYIPRFVSSLMLGRAFGEVSKCPFHCFLGGWAMRAGDQFYY